MLLWDATLEKSDMIAVVMGAVCEAIPRLEHLVKKLKVKVRLSH